MTFRVYAPKLRTIVNNSNAILSLKEDSTFRFVIINRQFQLTSINFHKYGSGKSYIRREAKMLKKFMTGSSSTKKKFYSVPQTPSKTLESLGSISTGLGSTSKKPLRRVRVLNDIFSEHITEMMSTGEIGEKLLGLGIQITGIRVANDFKVISVYWVTNEKENFAEVEMLLEKTARSLRHELSQLRVIGVVPPIQFVQDGHYFKALYVEKMLATLDYGPDYEPKEIGHGLRYVNQQSSQLTSAVKDEINELENSDETSGEETLTDEPIGPIDNMRHNLLGLDHFKLMSQVKERVMQIQNKIKTRDEEINTEIRPLRDINLASIEDDFENRKAEFQKFLKRRKIAMSKELKLQSVSLKEKELLETVNVREMDELDETNEIQEKDEFDDSYEKDLEVVYKEFKERF